MVVYGILQPNNAAGIEAEPSDSVIKDLVTSCLSNDNNERKIALKKIKEDSLLSDSVRDEIVKQIIEGLNEKNFSAKEIKTLIDRTHIPHISGR